MKMKIKINLNLIIILLIAVVFFIATSSFNYLTQTPDYVKWTSPDETANYFFAHRFSEGLNLAFFDEAAVLGDNMVMPRSFRSDFGWLKPVSFLGIILLYGSIGSLFGSAVIPFITPFLASLGIIIFYFIISKIFSKKLGVISAFLLAFFPVYIYYTVRSMFHNVLFIVLTLLGVYFLLLAASLYVKKRKKEASNEVKNELESDVENNNQESKNHFFSFYLPRAEWFKLVYSFLAGGFLGLAVITRTSELIWLAPSLFIAWIFYFKRFSITKIILIISGIFLAILPNIYFNQLLYSSPVYGGYNEMNRSIDDISAAGSGIVKSIFSGQEVLVHLKSIYHNIFYFGFNREQSLEMARHYIIEMFPWLSLIFTLGVLIALVTYLRRRQKKYLVYFTIFFILSAILIFYYGSWIFNDNPNPSRYTIGNSYTRYWLPIYLMMMPIGALAIYRLSRALAFTFKEKASLIRKKIIVALQVLFVTLLSVWSLDFVLFGSEEGLTHLYYNNLREKEYAQEIFSLTEEESVIITKYYDKFLFPERRIIMGVLPNDEVLTATSKLVYHYPVYYYNFYLNEADINYLNERKLPVYNLKLDLIKRISHDFGLYKFSQLYNIEELEAKTEDIIKN
jgi:4-amino-4-deoxy-L-arabinose transferase-like glycosyltransferase